VSAEPHQKILNFLTSEVARRDVERSVILELMFSPGRGFKDERVREWTRQDNPELFELDKLPGLVTTMIEIAEGVAEEKSAGRCRFFVRSTQFMRGRQFVSFSLESAFSNGTDGKTDAQLLATAERAEASALDMEARAEEMVARANLLMAQAKVCRTEIRRRQTAGISPGIKQPNDQVARHGGR
jgi:hypothetical protein